MNSPYPSLPSATRPVSPELSRFLNDLKPGQRIKLTQTVRIGDREWPSVVTGSFRKVSFLATGLATQRLAEDDIVVVTVHFTKDNGELSSIALDEQSKVELA